MKKTGSGLKAIRHSNRPRASRSWVRKQPGYRFVFQPRMHAVSARPGLRARLLASVQRLFARGSAQVARHPWQALTATLTM